MTDYVPDESKKTALFEIFRAAVWADLVGTEELTAAQKAGEKQGVTEKDLETISEWDAKKLTDYFGPAAINRDLVNAMKASDQFSSSMGRAFGMGGGAPFKNAGFY